MDDLSKHYCRFAITTGTGSGMLRELCEVDEFPVVTPYGTVWVQDCEIDGVRSLHLNRHGSHESISHGRYRLAHLLDYQPLSGQWRSGANMWALARLGVRRVIAISAMGSIDSAYPIRSVVLPHDCCTPSFGIRLTYADEDSGDEFYRGMIAGFCHVSRTLLAGQLHRADPTLTVNDAGVLSIVKGPGFEKLPDIKILQANGVHVVGMGTALPEFFLGGELGIHVSVAGVITDDPGTHVDQAEIKTIVRSTTPTIFRAAVETFRTLATEEGDLDQPFTCACDLQSVNGLREKVSLAI